MNRLTNAVALVAMVVAISGPVGYRLGGNVEKARSAAALIEANRENAATQKELMRAVEKVAQDAERERQEFEQRLAGASDAVGRLQSAINRANAGSATGTTCAADATRSRSLLAACAANYRDMAAAADRQRAVVIGLQEYVRSIRGATE